MNIFVANLNYKIQDAELRQLFEEYGTVTSARVIMDRETGRSKGYGFVEMSDDSEAEQAIRMINGQDIQGKQVAVKQALERKPQQGGGGGGYRKFNRNE
jgi:RNA recognition motif-containing protein